MRRLFHAANSTLAFAAASGPTWLWAQEGWPAYLGNPLDRGGGFYLAWWKLLLLWLVFLMWVKTTDWLNRDVQEVGESVDMPPDVWNPVTVISFLVAFVAALIIPIFFAGFALVCLAFVVPFSVYIVQRNGRVTDDNKLTFKSFFQKKKRKKESLTPGEEGPPIKLIPRGGADDSENKANLLTARQSPGYVTVKEWLLDAMKRRADRVMLDYTKDSVSCRYEIDGVWHDLPAHEREAADVALAVIKKLANLDMSERRARQEGEIGAQYGKNKFDVRLVSQGTKTGERVIVQLANKADKFTTLESVGMRDKMQEQLKEHLGAASGLVVFSSLPSGGLKTSYAAFLKATDRYLRDFAGVFDSSKRPMPYVENIHPNEYNGANDEAPDSILKQVILKVPDALVVPDMVNATTVNILCEQINEHDKLVVTTVRAKEAVEALLRILLLKCDPEPFSRAVTCVINQRLVRKLCEACRHAYQPQPQLLKKLGLPPERVSVLYRAFDPKKDIPEDDKKKKEPEPCAVCSGIGYSGRTGIFELVVVDDELRQALVSQPRLEVLRQIARKKGNRSMQEEGLLLVARGVTSLDELRRVLKQ